jgi:nucleoside-diphosphate-sugar epimerase
LRIGVTGASGFIGSRLTAAVKAAGGTVVPIARPFERHTIAATLRGVDAVVHLAGVVSAVRREDYVAANVAATAIVAAAARDAGVPMIHISSLAAAGPAPASAPRSEDDEPRPITDYGESKLEGEGAVRSTNDLRWIVLRPGVVYGPGDRALVPLFRYARAGILPLVGNEQAAYTFVYVDECVETILTAARLARDGACDRETMFVGHARPVTARQLLESIVSAGGSAARLVAIPRWLTRLAASGGDAWGALSGHPATINSRRFVELYSPGFVCRVDRLRERLGIVAQVDLTAGLSRSARWYSGR